MIPSELIAACAFLAAFGWLVFARSQRGRWQANALAWLGLPFFILGLLYTWFSIGNVPIEVRATHARFWIVFVSISHGIVLTLLAILQRKGGHGR